MAADFNPEEARKNLILDLKPYALVNGEIKNQYDNIIRINLSTMAMCHEILRAM